MKNLTEAILALVTTLMWLLPPWGETRIQFRLVLDAIRTDVADQRRRGWKELAIVGSVLVSACWIVAVFIDALRRLHLRATGEPSAADVIATAEWLRKQWRRGRAPWEWQMRFVERNLNVLNAQELIRVKVILANLFYLRGELHRGRTLIEDLMPSAELRAATDPADVLLLGYAFWNTDLFLGHHKRAARGLVELWRSFKRLPEGDQERLLDRLAGLSTVHPVGSIHRHLILAFAMSGERPVLSESGIDNSTDSDWIEARLDEGLRYCNSDDISIVYSKAYAAFALTLVLQDEASPGNRSLLEDRVEELLEVSDAVSPAGKYAAEGFRGIFCFANGEAERACELLASAEQTGSMSRNAFLCPLFSAVEAVALAHLERWGEADQCLLRFERLAKVPFHSALRQQADATLASLRNGTKQPRASDLSPRLAQLMKPRPRSKR